MKDEVGTILAPINVLGYAVGGMKREQDSWIVPYLLILAILLSIEQVFYTKRQR